MRFTNLDMDLLRTLAVATELGGLSRAAERLGRSPSAISLQMQKLEDQIGKPLFRKEKRGIKLTDAGDFLLGYAQKILSLNDEAMSITRGIDTEGIVRLGVPFDLTSIWLPKVLARFAQVHPRVHIELRTDRSVDLLNLFNQGLLDLALTFGPVARPGASFVADLPVHWIGRKGLWNEESKEWPLVLLDPPCCFRQMGVDALDRAQTAWRVAFTSPSLAGLWAATEAGIGITVRTSVELPIGLEILEPVAALPELPDVSLVLYNNVERFPRLTMLLESIMIETLQEALPRNTVRLVDSRSVLFDAAS